MINDTHAVVMEEHDALVADPAILRELLRDRSSGRNIIWATDDYAGRGEGFRFHDEITIEKILDVAAADEKVCAASEMNACEKVRAAAEASADEKVRAASVILPRAIKSKQAQSTRTRNMAEVFTPTWICNRMNNLADEAWFGRSEVFNAESGESWQAGGAKIIFPDYGQHQPKGWESYVGAKRLEITCGEAPYLVSRYDAVTGAAIPLEQRIGILDRKLRVINERTRLFQERERSRQRWLQLAKLALRSTYAFEWQGDNVLLARKNVLASVREYFFAKFGEELEREQLRELAAIISWNIWQMDGLKCVVPASCHEYKREPKATQPSLFDARAYSASVLKRSMSFSEVEGEGLRQCQGCARDNVELHNGIYCRIKNWSTGKIFYFKDLLSAQGGEKMSEEKDFEFDVVIGNPPYQEKVENDGDRANPLYDKFMDNAFKLADVVTLIHPARFLFNAGQTPKAWNKKMLGDEHFKVIHYESDAAKIFPQTEIKGGVAITLRDANKKYGAIKVFTAYEELNQIVHKILEMNTQGFLSEIVSPRGNYRTTEEFSADFPYASTRLGRGTGNMLVSNFFDKLPEAILEDKEVSSTDHLRILCRTNNERVIRCIKRAYIQDNDFIDSFNVASPEANGNGRFGERLTSSEILKPNEGATDTFISIGKFKTEYEAQTLQRYMKTKFFRALLGVKKVTQHCPPAVWQMIPLQDFTPNSDIDWTKSVAEIDQQLYKKYKLSEEEIEFIEKNVKPMD